MVKICTFYVSRFILKREVELVNNKLSSSSFLQQTTNLNSPWICRHNVCVALIGSFTFCIWYNVQQNEWSSVEFPFCLVDYHFLSLSLHHLLVMSIQKYVHTNANAAVVLLVCLVIDHRILRVFNIIYSLYLYEHWFVLFLCSGELL